MKRPFAITLGVGSSPNSTATLTASRNAAGCRTDATTVASPSSRSNRAKSRSICSLRALRLAIPTLLRNTNCNTQGRPTG